MFPPKTNSSQPASNNANLLPPQGKPISIPIRPRTQTQPVQPQPAQPEQTPPETKTNHLPTFFTYLIGLLTGIALVGGTLLFVRQPEPLPIVLHEPPTPAPTATPVPTMTPAPMTIFISGAVHQPGVYQLAHQSRVGDAIAQAGGLTEIANPISVNQAERLWDGAQVHVPTIVIDTQISQPPVGVSGASSPPPTADLNGEAAGSANSGKININIASASQLESLPGIGPSKAAAIVENRPYDSPDDLERVPGIGAKTVAQLRELVVVQ